MCELNIRARSSRPLSLRRCIDQLRIVRRIAVSAFVLAAGLNETPMLRFAAPHPEWRVNGAIWPFTTGAAKVGNPYPKQPFCDTGGPWVLNHVEKDRTRQAVFA